MYTGEAIVDEKSKRYVAIETSDHEETLIEAHTVGTRINLLFAETCH